MTVASLCGPTCGSQFFVHVFGALVLFGSVLAVAILAYAALRLAPRARSSSRRVGFWTTLVLMVPAWIAMYAGGYWFLGHEGLDKDTPGWAHSGDPDRRRREPRYVVLLLLGGWLAIRRPGLGPWVGWSRGALPRRRSRSPGSSCLPSHLSRAPARYRSISHWVSCTRYSSHSFRFSST